MPLNIYVLWELRQSSKKAFGLSYFSFPVKVRVCTAIHLQNQALLQNLV